MVEYVNAIQMVLDQDTKKRIERERKPQKTYFSIVEPLHSKDSANNKLPHHDPPAVKFHKHSPPPSTREEEWKDPNLGHAIDFIA